MQMANEGMERWWPSSVIGEMQIKTTTKPAASLVARSARVCAVSRARSVAGEAERRYR